MKLVVPYGNKVYEFDSPTFAINAETKEVINRDDMAEEERRAQGCRLTHTFMTRFGFEKVENKATTA